MKKLAHRGYSAYYPENTMIAFKKAYERGFDGVETDVHMTKDGQLVLIHDEKIDRTSNGQGYIQDYTLAELRQFNFAYQFDGIHFIPTLKELLSFIQGKDFIVNLGIKTDKIHYPHIEEKIITMVEEMGVQDQILYSSFWLDSVLKVKELRPSVYVGYLMEFQYKKKREALRKHHIQAFHPRYNYVNEERVKDLKKDHIQIATWTVPNIKTYKRLKELGVDIIISNQYLSEV